MESPSKAILEYYQRIDLNDTEWVLSLFSTDAIYERAGAIYRGGRELRNFFSIERRIRGIHTINEFWCVEPNIVVILGKFDGVGAAGDQRSVRFADVWRFNASKRVSHRETFLALGHGYVQR